MALKTSLIVDLAGNMQARARQYGQALSTMGQKGQTAMRGLKSAAVSAGQGLDKLGNRYTAMITGAGAGLAVKGVMDLQSRYTRLAITADASDAQVAKLKDTITDTANAPDIRLDPAQILSAVESIMEKTGDLKFATENIRNIGLAIQASGADGAAIGDIFAEFQKQGMSAKDAMATVDTLIAQGKAGAFTLKDLASLGPRVVTAYTALGRSGPQAMKEMGAVLQLIRMGTGSSEQAATAWEAMLRTFSDKKKLQFLQKQGITVLDKNDNIRAINDVMAEILKAAGNKSKNLSDVFDAEAIRAFNAILAETKKTGGSETLEKLLKIQGDGTTVQADSARAAKTANAALQSLKTTWDSFADAKLAEPIQQAADALNRIGPEKMMQTLNTAKNVAMVLGGVVLASKAIGVAANVRSLFGKKGGAAPAGMGAMNGLSGLKLPLPVYIVNKQMSLTKDAMLGKDGAISSTSGTAASSAKGKAKAGAQQKATSGVQAGVVIATALNAGRVLMDDEATLAEKAEGVAKVSGEAMGGWAGAALGAKAGAVLGSFIPGFGTAIGAALGAAVGGIGGSMAGGMGMDAAMSWVKGLWAKDKPEAQMQPLRDDLLSMQENFKGAVFDSVLRVQVDGPATATLQSNNSMGGIDVYSGTSFSKGF